MKQFKDLTNIFKNTDISFIKNTISNKGLVRGFILDKLLTRSEIDNLDKTVKEEGSAGLGWFKVADNEITGPLTKILKDNEIKEIKKYNNSTIIFQAGTSVETASILDLIRREIYVPNETEQYKFLWVDEFPYFESENGELQPSHHPFTSPKNTEEFNKNPENATALHYDLVLNGVELGSGSQRINDPNIQTSVLSNWGLTESEIEQRFGWFIEALSYGSPQHAGFAIGIDRLIAEMVNADSIRDVIPFPKTQSGLDPLTNAPARLSGEDLLEYSIKVDLDEDE